MRPIAQPLGCITGTRPVREVHIDLYFTLDKSRSMRTSIQARPRRGGTRYASALDSFINAPLSQGLGAGIYFFPRVSPSGKRPLHADDYRDPVVRIGTLPGRRAEHPHGHFVSSALDRYADDACALWGTRLCAAPSLSSPIMRWRW